MDFCSESIAHTEHLRGLSPHPLSCLSMVVLNDAPASSPYHGDTPPASPLFIMFRVATLNRLKVCHMRILIEAFWGCPGGAVFSSLVLRLGNGVNNLAVFVDTPCSAYGVGWSSLRTPSSPPSGRARTIVPAVALSLVINLSVAPRACLFILSLGFWGHVWEAPVPRPPLSSPQASTRRSVSKGKDRRSEVGGIVSVTSSNQLPQQGLVRDHLLCVMSTTIESVSSNDDDEEEEGL
ncbi:hypothetical protein GWK47_046315 [Chionoecetes opilio]|uniref:Uncharacterized protein n=1 Tax=Chionoecetes opilio TaxID=41210 RepID=A0A8J5CX81_CHIOP|nr:hypothetical protein GWK47_046315 [Chionoecetes opilio]